MDGRGLEILGQNKNKPPFIFFPTCPTCLAPSYMAYTVSASKMWDMCLGIPAEPLDPREPGAGQSLSLSTKRPQLCLRLRLHPSPLILFEQEIGPGGARL